MPPTINSRVFVEASHGSPERYLLAAMLEQAIADCLKVKTRQSSKPVSEHRAENRKYHHAVLRNNRRDALEWVFHESDPRGNRALSFDWCCHQLGHSASDLRQRVRATINGKLSERHLWINLGHKWGLSRRPA